MGIHIDPEKKDTWYVSYSKRHPISKKSANLRRKGFKTFAEAKRAFNRIVIDVENKLHRTEIPTWSKLVDEFLIEGQSRDYSPNTIENYRSCLKVHTFSEWSERLVDTITTQEIRDLIRGKIGIKSPSQQRSILKYVRGVFSFGVDQGYLKSNPTPNLKIKLNEKTKKVLTVEQVRHFLNKAKEYEHEWYAHWALAVYTGMRSGELYALTWDKINFETAQIIIDTSWTKRTGFKSTKSGDDRIVGIAPTMVPILKELKLQAGTSTYVLPRRIEWDRGEQAKELQKFLIGIGLPAIRFHDLRATWATILLGRGIEPVKVMKMGGWSELKTLQIYLRMAGIDTRGTLNDLVLHEPSTQSAKILNLPVSNDL